VLESVINSVKMTSC